MSAIELITLGCTFLMSVLSCVIALSAWLRVVSHEQKLAHLTGTVDQINANVNLLISRSMTSEP